jgi:hypothetical protein
MPVNIFGTSFQQTDFIIYLYRCTIVNDHTSYIQRALVKNKLLVLLGKFLLQHRNYNNSTNNSWENKEL